MLEPNWLKWAKELQAIAQAGLTYSSDIYDIERFEEIRKLSIEIMTTYTGTNPQEIKDLFANETGYATPKVDIRAVVFHEGKLLMVKENMDNKWSLPGGWADVGLSPREVAEKEVKEESGYDVKASRLIAILDKKLHPHPPSAYHVYKIFIECELIGGTPETGLETNQVAFFSKENIPDLSVARNTLSQIKMLFDYKRNPIKDVILD